MVEHICNFDSIVIVLFLVSPGVFGVENFGVDSGDRFRILQVEYWQSLVFRIAQRSVVDGVNDGSSILNADSLNIKNITLPIP